MVKQLMMVPVKLFLKMGNNHSGQRLKRTLKKKASLSSENEYLKMQFKITDEQLKEYRSLFKDHSDNNKVITRSEFRDVYQLIYKSGDATEFADRVFDVFDSDKSGTVDFIEFAAGLTMMDSEKLEQKISIAFSMYDEDGSNTLSKQEVINMIQAYYRLLGPDVSRSPVEIANDLFRKMDLDKDDSVTYEEFASVAKRDPTVLEILNPKA
ncbi:neurocalcin homolog isoform X1 [Mytilus trossulus]|uniref:neurocalcin homolog isoform X1 n=2 Tax=Mytilus trossulus TaxID=6551 RepID=UPI003005A292